MRRIRIDRVELSVAGVDAATVEAAMRALPGALGRRLGGVDATTARGPVKVSRDAPSADLADRLAIRIAGDVRARGGEGGRR